MSEEDSIDLSVGDVAKILGISISTVRIWTDEGHLSSKRTPGKHRRYSKKDIDEFLRKMRPIDHP